MRLHQDIAIREAVHVPSREWLRRSLRFGVDSDGFAERESFGRPVNRVQGNWSLDDLWAELSVPMPLWKRSADFLVSSLLFLALLPLFIVVGAAILLRSLVPVTLARSSLCDPKCPSRSFAG
jgi:hypothetical protein